MRDGLSFWFLTMTVLELEGPVDCATQLVEESVPVFGCEENGLVRVVCRADIPGTSLSYLIFMPNLSATSMRGGKSAPPRPKISGRKRAPSLRNPA